MRYVKQFAIIVIISFMGEILNRVIPAPIPASIYGLLLMFCALRFKIFPVSKVKETSAFMIEVMPIMFVTPSVSIILAVDTIKEYWWQITIISIVTTLAVFAVTGIVTQALMKTKAGNTQKHAKNAAQTTQKHPKEED